MSHLNWQEESQAKTSTVAPAAANPWFGIAMGLMGLIAGFVLGTALKPVSFAAQPSAQQVAMQNPAAAPKPSQQPVAAKPAPGPLLPLDVKTDHIRGNAKATVAVIEYSDFECPFCKRVEPTFQQISKEYGDNVMVVYRHFPLNFHPNAQKEAEASDCAADQGKFWEFHDALLERTTSNGTGFPLANLVPLAKELGLNESSFQACLDDGKYAKHVKDEELAGQAAGVNGTPGTFIVNLQTQKNQMISGAQPFSVFKAAIDSMLGDAPAAAAAAIPDAAKEQTIKMTAELSKFSPNVLTMKKGAKVTLEVTGLTGTHGLSVPGLGINEMIFAGKTVTVQIPTDTAGTYDFNCSIQCGPGHDAMKGQIIIEA